MANAPASSTTPLTRFGRALSGRTPLQLAAAVWKTALKSAHATTPAVRAAAKADRAFDDRWGTDTSREVGMSQLDFPTALKRSSDHYQASGAHMLDLVITLAGIDPAAFSFIDYGCGKGRMVLLAAARPFARAIGVEYSAMLTETARANSAIFAARGGALIAPEFWQGNAADYAPPEGNLFCYVYNSFGADILAGCVDRLEAAADIDPDRRILLAYANPQFGDMVASRSRWQEVAGADELRLFACRSR